MSLGRILRDQQGRWVYEGGKQPTEKNIPKYF